MKYQLTASEFFEVDAEMKMLIDSFNLKEIKNYIDYKDDIQDFFRTSFLRYLLNKIDENLENVAREIQNNSWYNCSQVLIFIEELMENNIIFSQEFQSYEHLICIIEYTDDLLIYEYVLQILKSFDARIQQNLTLRILYFQKILYDHVNYLASKKIELIDFYYQDPKYNTITCHPIDALQFDIEYYEPTQLVESYEYLSQNLIENISLYREIQTKKITIIDDHSSSALNLSRNLLNMHDKHISPMIEILKYRILIRRGLLSKPEQTRNTIIKLHLKSFQYLQDLLKNEYNLDSIKYFKQNVKDFEDVDYFNLFKLQTIDTLVLKELLLIYSRNIKESYYQKKAKEILGLLQDVLSIQHIEKNEQILGYPLRYSPQIMTERLARNELIINSILKFFQPLSNERSLEKYQEINETQKILKKALSIQDNKLMLPPKQLIGIIRLLSFLSVYSDLQRNNQIFDYFLEIAEYYINQSLSLQKPTENGYIQICLNEAYEIIYGVIKAIIQVFGQNKYHDINQDRDSIFATKILDSKLLSNITTKLQQAVQLNKTILITFKLVSTLLNAAPQLTVIVINTNLPDFLNEIIQKINIVELKSQNMINILNFYQNISQQENGFQKFNNDAIIFFERVLYYHLITRELIQKQSLIDLASIANKNNEKSITLIIKIVIKVLQLFLQQLTDKQNQLNYDQNFKSQYVMIIKKKRAIEQFMKTLSQNNRFLHSEGYFDIFVMLFKIPQFSSFTSFNLDPYKCLKKAFELIESWEADLGFSLYNSKNLVQNQQQFLENCSLQTYQVTSRFSEILHYFNEVKISIQSRRLQVQILNDDLINKCIAIFEIQIISQFWISKSKIVDDANHPCAYILVIIFILIKRTHDRTNRDQILSQFFSKISLLLNNIPEITLQILKQIIFLLEFLQKRSFEIQDIIFNSKLDQNLQNTLENYIRIINSVNPNQQLIQDLNENILQILKLLYDSPRQNHSLSTKKKMIENIQNLILITQDSSHQNIQQIKQYLLIKGFFMQSQNFIYPTRNNDSIYQYSRAQLNLYKQQIDNRYQIEQEALGVYLKQNIFFFSNSLIDKLQNLNIKFDELELYKYLELIVDRLFKLKLNFLRIKYEQQEIQNLSNVNINSLIVLLHLIYQQNNLLQDQYSFILELLKLLVVLLIQEDQNGHLAANFILAIFNQQNTYDYCIFALIKKGIKLSLNSNVQNHITSKICIDILVKVFLKERQYVTEFVLKKKGLEALLKMKGEFCQIAMAIIYDQTLVRVQLETQIKRILFNQEQNNEIKKTNLQQNYLNQNPYPICIQPTYYNVLANENLKLAKNHPALLALEKEHLFKEDFKYIMNLLFKKSIDDQYFVLKQGIALDTLNSINQNENSILQFNFKHKQETQTLFRLFIQQMITSYFENNEHYQYHWNTILDVLQLLIKKFPILLPQLLRINCQKFLINHINPSQQISFLTLITRIINPSKNFIFYICLDNLVLFRKSDNVIVPFAYEIRRLVICELFVEINKSIQVFDEKICRFSDILMTLLQIKSVAKICIQNINEPLNSFNFIKTYIDGIKNFDIKQYFIFKNQLFIIINTLNMLYSVAINLLLEKIEPIDDDSFQMFPDEINQQLFQNLMLPSQDGVKQNQIIRNLLSQKWSLLTVKNEEFYVQIEEEQEIPFDKLLKIENYENSYEICAAALEQQSINWIDENDQVTENFHSKNLENQNILYNPQMKNKSDQFLWDCGYFNIDLNILLPLQFQEILTSFQSVLPQQNNLPINSMNRFWQDELYQNSNHQIIDIIKQDYEDRDSQNINQEDYFEQVIQQDDDLLQDIKNTIKSVLNNRKQTLKLLGLVDHQFLQFIIKFLQVDDNFESLDNSINTFLMNLGTSSLIANQIIDYLINNLKLIRQQNFDKEMFIVTRNVITSDLNQFSKFISPKILQTLLKVVKSSKCSLSTQNFRTMTELLFKFEDNNLELIIQVLQNYIKYQQNIEKLHCNRIHDLYILFMKEKNNQRIQLFFKLISILMKNYSNFIRFQEKIQNHLKQVTQNFENHLIQKNTNDQITDQEDGIKKIFQLIQYIFYNLSIENSSQKNDWHQFLEQPELQQLWTKMEKSISTIQPLQVQEYSSFLLPYIESFLICDEIINHNEYQSFQFPKLSSMEISNSQSDHNDFDYKKLFLKLSQNGKDYINSIIKEQIEIQHSFQNTRGNNNQSKKRSLLEYFVEYFVQTHHNIIYSDVKKKYFRNKIDHLRQRNEAIVEQQKIIINININTVFEDSYRQISILNTNQLKTDFQIKFVGQIGQDYGGLIRNWFKILSKEILNPQRKLFIRTPNRIYYQINSESYLDYDHLNKFKFVGKIFAKALMQDCLIHGKFSTLLFKHILGRKLSIEDWKDYDSQELASMKYIYNNNDISNLDCFFTYYINNRGQLEEKELIPGGKDIEVTPQNKKDYIRKYCHQFMAKNIENQIKAIQEGFYSIIPKNLIAIFDSKEFKSLLCGKEYIKVENLIENLKYNRADIQVIQWLENILRTYNQDKLAKFLNFVTGTDLVPAGGFQALSSPIEIQIQHDITDTNHRFPEAYTCHNLLVIPAYDSEEVLREKLEIALYVENDNFQRG
ncbi:unnamed protein product [Paramecium sonneborni]|uniref:HECT domain-containing protein n=1 Tax=Paramecium sonneborni TaxID=65129 RepID=A0A8S1QVX0_9CILI|nr:unnamed protein product [Paramecium sonneborni]